MSRIGATTACALAFALGACAATQTGENTVEMADGISHIREVQVLRNIAAAISDHDMVPSQILLGSGQASVSAGLSPFFSFPNFDPTQATREFDLGASDSWTAQWQFTSVTNAEDLRRLRNLYVLVASSDADYDRLQAYFARHPELRESGQPEHVPPNQPAPTGYLKSFLGDSAGAPPAGHALIGSNPGNVPLWKQAITILRTGDSIDCKLFQEPRLGAGTDWSPEKGGIPFRRWLYWREPGAKNWLPSPPEGEPQSLGTFGNWELGVTSRACFDDFVILVQGQLPATENANVQGPKVMLSNP